MARKKNLKLADYNEGTIKEEKEKLVDEEEFTDDYEEETKETKTDLKHQNRIKLAINIVFAVIIILMIMVSFDVISVGKYEKGPYFAINTKTMDDGGTKIYYGLGYKVIKYNQTQGRRDIQVGFWSMAYSTEPTETTALDLAIEFNNDPKETYQRLYKAFLRVSGTYTGLDKDNNVIISYNDPDGSYTLNIVCKMAEGIDIPENSENAKAVIIGTLRDFKYKTDTTPNTVYMSDCFIEFE